MIYLGPGLYDAGSIPLESGQTLYLSGGACLWLNQDRITRTILRFGGRGIISGEIYSRLNQSDVTVRLK